MKPEQFTNPHYQKILEKTINHKYPELSFEEGLKMEAKHIGCYITVITSPYAPQYTKTEIASILWDDGIDCAGNERWYCFRNSDIEPHTFTTIKKQDTILGRPITICEIVDVLVNNKRIINIKYTPFRIQSFRLQADLELQPKTYYLHEQSIEIQEQIANLF